MDFASFFKAIAGQESGGNYSAVNGRTGALGKYQILPGNIGPWSRQYLGTTITPTAFLNSPTLQEKLAGAVLRSYYIKYGARGAAAAWYSGDYRKANDYHRFRADEPSIGEYVDQVLGRAGGDGGDAPAYSYLPGKTIDNRVKQSSMLDLFGDQLPKNSTQAAGIGAASDAAVALGAAEGGVGNTVGEPTGTADLPELANISAGLPSNSATVKGQRGAFVNMAEQFLGTPYRWGGAQPGGFDCSGLIQYAFKQIGVNFPRVSFDQLSMGKRTSVSSLQAGDLVGFGNGGHVAIYLGGGRILEAPRSGLNVRVRSLGKGENAWGVSLDSIYR